MTEPATKTETGHEDFTEIAIDEIDTRSPRFHCPHCRTLLQFDVGVKVRGVYEIKNGDDGTLAALVPQKSAQRPPVDPLSITERRIIDRMKKLGIFDAFQKAVFASGRNVKPKNLDRYFLTFLHRASPMRYPDSAIRRCLPEALPTNTVLELWQLDSTCAITANGQFRAFLPIQLIKGQSIASLTSTKGTIGTTRTTMTDWIRTRHGYVAGSGPLMGELRKHAAGNFDNLNI